MEPVSWSAVRHSEFSFFEEDINSEEKINALIFYHYLSDGPEGFTSEDEKSLSFGLN